MTLLEIDNLKTTFETEQGTVEAVNNISLSVERGETVGIVGESGSGKSVSALSIMDLVESPGSIAGGEIRYDNQRLHPDPNVEPASLRGSEIGMVFQHPSQNFNPVLPVGEQIAEVARAHGVIEGEEITKLDRSIIGNFLPRRDAWKRNPKSWNRAVKLMDEVGIPEPDKRAREYPHQFSGGMLQRALIAQALAGIPELLIADEPTTALDVTVQKQILNLFANIQEERDMGMILITHNLGVVQNVCDRVAVMYSGQIVEKGAVEDVFEAPKHPYTAGLLQSIPNRANDGEMNPIDGQIPNLVNMPDECFFAPRCEHAHESCYQETPRMYDISETSQRVRCVLHDDQNPHSLEGDDARRAPDIEATEKTDENAAAGGNNI